MNIYNMQSGWLDVSGSVFSVYVIKTDDVCKAKAGRNVASAAPAAAAAHLEWAG